MICSHCTMSEGKWWQLVSWLVILIDGLAQIVYDRYLLSKATLFPSRGERLEKCNLGNRYKIIACIIKERLRNCSLLKEIKEICRLNAMHDLVFSFAIKDVIGMISKTFIKWWIISSILSILSSWFWKSCVAI